MDNDYNVLHLCEGVGGSFEWNNDNNNVNDDEDDADDELLLDEESDVSNSNHNNNHDHNKEEEEECYDGRLLYSFRAELPKDSPPTIVNAASVRYFYYEVLCVSTVNGIDDEYDIDE